MCIAWENSSREGFGRSQGFGHFSNAARPVGIESPDERGVVREELPGNHGHDRREELGPGDFVGFAAAGPAHHVRAARGEDLVYVHGGDAWGAGTIELVDLPDRRLRTTLVGATESMTFPVAAALEPRKP